MKKIIFIVIFVILINSLFYCQENENLSNTDETVDVIKTSNSTPINELLTSKVKNLDEKAKVGKQYLVIIAIDKYKNRLPLDYYVDNAKGLRNILYKKFYINEVYQLYNYDASKKNIESLFKHLIRKIRPIDSVVIYYGGHGSIDDKTNEGYWIPYDGGLNEYSKENWIPNADIQKYMNKLRANHVFLISDSCFSAELIQYEYETKEKDDVYFKTAYSKKARQVLCSGVKDTGLAESNFISKLKSYLSRTNAKYLDPVMIFNSIKRKVNMDPVFGELKSSKHQENGSYLFYLRENDPAEYKDEIVAKEEIDKDDDKDADTDNIDPASLANKEKINFTGKILCPLGASITCLSIIMFVTDIIIVFPEILRYTENPGEYKSYSEYERVYYTNIALFTTSIVLFVIGGSLLGISIPMILYKKDKSKIKKNKMSLNITAGNEMSLFISYHF